MEKRLMKILRSKRRMKRSVTPVLMMNSIGEEAKRAKRRRRPHLKSRARSHQGIRL
jgi:hypothetical protein